MSAGGLRTHAARFGLGCSLTGHKKRPVRTPSRRGCRQGRWMSVLQVLHEAGLTALSVGACGRSRFPERPENIAVEVGPFGPLSESVSGVSAGLETVVRRLERQDAKCESRLPHGTGGCGRRTLACRNDRQVACTLEPPILKIRCEYIAAVLDPPRDAQTPTTSGSAVRHSVGPLAPSRPRAKRAQACAHRSLRRAATR
jgi:hypothetical protein